MSEIEPAGYASICKKSVGQEMEFSHSCAATLQQINLNLKLHLL